MVKKIINGKDHYESSNYAEFLCDAESDIENLPGTKGSNGVAVGSLATVIESKNVYILSSNGWKLFGVAGASGSTGSSIDIATLDEIKSYIG